MKLTTRGRYAVTSMLDLALHSQNKPICLSDIACRQDISSTYLEQLFAKLKRKQLVDSVRGPGGGYLLAKAPERITICDIIEAVDECLDPKQYESNRENMCDSSSDRFCEVYSLWEALNLLVKNFLDDISLADLMKQPLTIATPRSKKDITVNIAKKR